LGYVAQSHSCLPSAKDGGGLYALYPGENIFYRDASYFKPDFSLYLQLQQ